MAKLLKLPSKAQARPLRWDVYRAAAKAKWVGTVEAPTADAAIKAAAEEFNVSDARKLIAVQRR